MGAQGRLRTVALAAGLALALLGCRDPSEKPAALPVAGRLVLNGVTVVDTRDGTLAPGMSLLAEAGKIVRIAPVGSLAPDASAESIDATGKFVVPGYLDMHAHPLGPGDPSGDLALMLAHGVTGFRQMAGSAELLSQRRAGTLPISLDAPALLATAGPVLTPFNARSPEAAAATLREQQALGADFVKVALATPEVFFAVLEEAERIGIPAVGHVPMDVDVVAASRGGMRSIEHLGPGNGILVACSTDEVALRRDAPKIPGALRGPPFEIPFADALVSFLIRDRIINPAAGAGAEELGRVRRAVATYSDEKCRQVAAELVANDTWQVPTLIRIRSSQLAFEPGLQNDPNLRYVARSTLERWRKVTRKFDAELSPEDERTLRDVYALDLALVKRLDAAGVKMMAGSDVVGAGWLVPGVSLHQELDELEKAGLSPLRVLQMATLRGAEFLGRTSSLGSVEPGKDADLVLLDANPLESVQNLHAIHAVVRAGFHRSWDDLEALKRKLEAGAAAH